VLARYSANTTIVTPLGSLTVHGNEYMDVSEAIGGTGLKELLVRVGFGSSPPYGLSKPPAWEATGNGRRLSQYGYAPWPQSSSGFSTAMATEGLGLSGAGLLDHVYIGLSGRCKLENGWR
jgi:hypothetical protein